MKKGFSRLGALIAVLVIAFVGVATYFVIDGNNKATNYDNYDFNAPIAGDEHNGYISDHQKTAKEITYTGEPVYIFEYADYQCPGCASMNPRVNQAVNELNGKLVVVYRNHLLSYHQNATAAASAAEAAGLQGYWKEYADLLFTNQSEWEYASGSARTAYFEQYFETVSNGSGDLEKFRADVASSEVSKKISFDMGLGKRLDIPGTPAFFIDGELIPWSEDGGSVTVNGKTISWEEKLSGSEFVKILKQIVAAKLGETD